LGLSLIHWNLDPFDWRSRNADMVYDSIMSRVKDGCIIVCHDIHMTTGEAMERVIPELIENGYRLVTVSELLGETEPGDLYKGRE